MNFVALNHAQIYTALAKGSEMNFQPPEQDDPRDEDDLDQNSVSLFEKMMRKAGAIDIDRFQGFVLALSNGSHVRHWIDYRTRNNGQMVFAIQCLDYEGKPCEILGFESFGFVTELNFGKFMYFINRVDKDGSPYIKNW